MPDIAGYDHSWFIVTRKIIEREFALSGWEQNPDITNRDYKLLLKSRLGRAPHRRSRSHKILDPDSTKLRNRRQG